jgi:hypothetical protein
MSHNRECRYLDETKGERDITEKRTMDGIESTGGDIRHPCLSQERLNDNPDLDEWISGCPEKCRYFEPK